MYLCKMKEFWKNYKSTLLLLLGIVLGGITGGVWPASAPFLKPIGDIFMNLLFVLIVPMVLFSVSSSISNLNARSVLGRTLGITTLLMVLMMLLGAVMAYCAVLLYPPVEDGVLSGMSASGAEERSIGELVVGSLTVTDFCMLLSVKHILPLMLVSGLLGWAASKMETDKVAMALQGGCDLVMKMMDQLMLLAPIGLGCYFAGMMAEGSLSLLSGYGRFLTLYLILTAVVYFLVNPLMALIAMGVKGQSRFWSAILQPSLMAISSLSSSACMPTNIAAVKKMGVSPELADSIVPLGTQVYKFGSVISGVLKVAFVVLLCGQDITSPEMAFVVVGVGLLSSVVVGAVPTGAGTAELLICSILGVDPTMVGLLMVLSTLVDMPGTLLNVTGNTTLTILANRFIEKKN